MTQEEVTASVVTALEQLNVPYMIVGSFASSLHGVPRMTNDADVVIDADERTVVRLARLLESDFYVSEDAAREAVRLKRMFNVIHYDSGFKVDLVIKKDRPFSVQELRRREPGTLAGRMVSFATAEDTILTKLEWSRAADSERQYEDAAGIIRVRHDDLDWDYLQEWAEELELLDLLDRARRRDPWKPGR